MFEHCDRFSNFQTFHRKLVQNLNFIKKTTERARDKKAHRNDLLLCCGIAIQQEDTYVSVPVETLVAARKVNSARGDAFLKHLNASSNLHSVSLVRFKGRIFYGGTTASRVRGKAYSRKKFQQ